MSIYPQGSIWRRWDLHIHSPFSVLNMQFQSNFDSYAKSLFEAAVERQIAAIGVTDYFCIEGYRQLRAIQADRKRLVSLCGEAVAERAAHILLLPNVEFRIDKLIEKKAVNIHVLFSNELEPDVIESEFLHQLKFVFAGRPDHGDETRSLTMANLAALGVRLKSEDAEFAKYTDLFTGMNNAKVSDSEITEVLASTRSVFYKKYLLAVSCDEVLSSLDWKGQDHLTRKNLYSKCNFLFTTNPKTVHWALGKRHDSEASFIAEFGSIKPCLGGSDAHRESEFFRQKEHRYTWVKSDPTFKGLLHAVSMPEDRIYIGDAPPNEGTASLEGARYLQSVEVRKLSQTKVAEKWFDFKLCVNPGLVAIIGRKGSGKSALADIVGLLGGSRRLEHFSFLNKDKFRRGKNASPSSGFQGQIVWCSGEEGTKQGLHEDPPAHNTERVTYIPQEHLEKMCTDIRTDVRESAFSKVLEEVLFSLIGRADQLGCNSFSQLLERKTSPLKGRLASLRQEVNRLNLEIVATEKKRLRSNHSALSARLTAKQSELNAIQNPAAVPDPSQSKPETLSTDSETTKKLGELRASKEKSEARSEALNSEKIRLVSRIAAASDLIENLTQLEDQFRILPAKLAEDLATIGIPHSALPLVIHRDVDSVGEVAGDRPALLLARPRAQDASPEAIVVEVGEADALYAAHPLARLEIWYTPLELAVEQSKQGKAQVEEELAGIADVSAEVQKTIKSLELKLAEPAKKFEDYKRRLQEAEEKRRSLRGDATTQDTILYIQKQLEDYAALPQTLTDLRARRAALLRDIHSVLVKELEILRELYRPFAMRVEEAGFEINQPLRITADFTLQPFCFTDGFLANVHMNRPGRFRIADEARKLVGEMLAGVEFDRIESVVEFISDIETELKYSTETPDVLYDQLKDADPQNLYDFLYSLEYLAPAHELRWDGKPLAQLSPGERGTLLLLFFTLIDRSGLPLVLDQPEENLDNQTVYTTLVPALKAARKRRQVIMVTHNPNLAVVCDADQIICAELDKGNGIEIRYESGSLEDDVIARKVVDILEGTMPAFTTREKRYEIGAVL